MKKQPYYDTEVFHADAIQYLEVVNFLLIVVIISPHVLYQSQWELQSHTVICLLGSSIIKSFSPTFLLTFHLFPQNMPWIKPRAILLFKHNKKASKYNKLQSHFYGDLDNITSVVSVFVIGSRLTKESNMRIHCCFYMMRHSSITACAVSFTGRKALGFSYLSPQITRSPYGMPGPEFPLSEVHSHYCPHYSGERQSGAGNEINAGTALELQPLIGPLLPVFTMSI